MAALHNPGLHFPSASRNSSFSARLGSATSSGRMEGKRHGSNMTCLRRKESGGDLMEWKPKKIFQQRAEWAGHCGGSHHWNSVRLKPKCLFTEFGQSKSTIAAHGPQGCVWVPTHWQVTLGEKCPFLRYATKTTYWVLGNNGDWRATCRLL
jgi:hypothetical protein